MRQICGFGAPSQLLVKVFIPKKTHFHVVEPLNHLLYVLTCITSFRYLLMCYQGVNITLSTRSCVIPSYQADSIFFHNENFLQLEGIVLTHPPFFQQKRELTQHFTLQSSTIL